MEGNLKRMGKKKYKYFFNIVIDVLMNYFQIANDYSIKMESAYGSSMSYGVVPSTVRHYRLNRLPRDDYFPSYLCDLCEAINMSIDKSKKYSNNKYAQDVTYVGEDLKQIFNRDYAVIYPEFCAKVQQKINTLFSDVKPLITCIKELLEYAYNSKDQISPCSTLEFIDNESIHVNQEKKEEIILTLLNPEKPSNRVSQKYHFTKERYNSTCLLSNTLWEREDSNMLLYQVDGKLYGMNLLNGFSEELPFDNVDVYYVDSSELYFISNKRLVKYDLANEVEIGSAKLADRGEIVQFFVKDNVYIITSKNISIYSKEDLSLMNRISIDKLKLELFIEDIKYLCIVDAVLDEQELIISLANLDASEEEGGLSINCKNGSKKNYICGLDLASSVIIPFKNNHETAKFINTSSTRIGEHGHNYLTINNDKLFSYFDNYLYIWDKKTKVLIDSINIHIHEHGIEAIDYYNNYIITGGFSGEIKFWDIEAKRCSFTLLEHSHWITDLKVIGEKLYSASGDNLIIRWDLGKIIHTEEFTQNLTASKWNNQGIYWNGKRIYANFESGYVEMELMELKLSEDEQKLGQVQQLYRIGKKEKDINFYIDDHFLFIDIFAVNNALNSLLVRIDLLDVYKKAVKIEHEDSISKMLCFDNKIILCSQFSGEISVFNNRNLALESIKEIHDEGILDISQNSLFFTTIAMDNYLKVWDKRNFELVQQMEGWGAVYICDSFLVHSTISNELKLLSFDNMTNQYQEIKSVAAHSEMIEEILVYEDREIILTRDKYHIFFWDYKLNRLGKMQVNKNIKGVRIAKDILTVSYGNRSEDIFKLDITKKANLIPKMIQSSLK